MLLELEHISKSFGAVTAVNDLSCAVVEGEVLGIMGPNGAGKTTILNLIMGAVPLTKGTIRFAGERIDGIGVSAVCNRGIARTYQIPQPFKQMTVLDNLLVGELYGSRHQSMRVARARALEILERVGLAQQGKTLAGRLGLLELKRLELARALSLQQRLLLLDEIAGGLIESEIEVLKEILMDLKRSGQTMIIIEHVLGLLFDLSDRIMVLDFGECIAEGKPVEVIRDPQVIKAYLGTERVEADSNFVPMALSEIPDAPSIHIEPVTSVDEITIADKGILAVPEQVTDTNRSGRKGDVLLSMSHVSASYGEFQALFDVSMEIRRSEIVALIGLNGAGKTTLIRAMTRLLPLKGGTVTFHNTNLARLQPQQIVEQGIAQCIEGRKIFPELTVLENLEVGAYCKHARAKRNETLERVYDLFPILKDRRNQTGSTLSGGQQQMLAIGRALMALPELIIFDEISLGLAPLIIDDIYTKINEINRQGTTILLVEQSVERSLSVAQYAYVIESGRIMLSGSAESLRQNSTFREVYFGL